jgi:hypothetical protein
MIWAVKKERERKRKETVDSVLFLFALLGCALMMKRAGGLYAEINNDNHRN